MSDIGHFMFGVGALIMHPDQQKLLILKRSSQQSDFNNEKWELVYGRKNQHEDITSALHRECQEEIGVDHVDIGPVLRLWHFYRGSLDAKNEILGITFVCSIGDQQPRLSSEHSEYKWVSPSEALNLITVSGIRQDITLYAEKKWADSLPLTDLSGNLTIYDQENLLKNRS